MHNFAPRLSLAYSPGYHDGTLGKIFGGPGKSSIRAGFGMYYDRVGGAIATDQAVNAGDPGLVNSELTPIGLFSLATAPRFSGTCSVAAGCSGFPALSTFFPNAPTNVTFPFTPDTGIDNFDFAVNQRLKVPYSYAMDFSLERELGRGFTVEAAYVGNLGHRLLLKKDYGQYMGEFKDVKSGQTLWQAYNLLVKQMGSLTNQTPASQITPIAWMQDLMPNMPAYAAAYLGNPAVASMTPTQAFYSIVQTYAPDWSDAVLAMDDPFASGLSPWSLAVDPQQDGRVLFGPQFDSIPSWTSEGFPSAAGTTEWPLRGLGAAADSVARNCVAGRRDGAPRYPRVCRPTRRHSAAGLRRQRCGRPSFPRRCWSTFPRRSWPCTPRRSAPHYRRKCRSLDSFQATHAGNGPAWSARRSTGRSPDSARCTA